MLTRASLRNFIARPGAFRPLSVRPQTGGDPGVWDGQVRVTKTTPHGYARGARGLGTAAPGATPAQGHAAPTRREPDRRTGPRTARGRAHPLHGTVTRTAPPPLSTATPTQPCRNAARALGAVSVPGLVTHTQTELPSRGWPWAKLCGGGVHQAAEGAHTPTERTKVVTNTPPSVWGPPPTHTHAPVLKSAAQGPRCHCTPPYTSRAPDSFDYLNKLTLFGKN